MGNNDNKRKLYDALSVDYDMGSYDNFLKDIEDPNKRKKLFDATSEEYDFGDYNKFSSQLGFGGDVIDDSNVGMVQDDTVEQPAQPQQEEQEYVKGFVPGMKQGADVLYQGTKSAVGEAANLLTGSQRDYSKALEQLDEMVGLGYDLKDFNVEKALNDYRMREYNKNLADWEETMKQRRAERENMGVLESIGHKILDPKRPSDPYDRSARAFSEKKLGDEVQIERAYQAFKNLKIKM